MKIFQEKLPGFLPKIPWEIFFFAILTLFDFENIIARLENVIFIFKHRVR